MVFAPPGSLCTRVDRAHRAPQSDVGGETTRDLGVFGGPLLPDAENLGVEAVVLALTVTTILFQNLLLALQVRCVRYLAVPSSLAGLIASGGEGSSTLGATLVVRVRDAEAPL